MSSWSSRQNCQSLNVHIISDNTLPENRVMKGRDPNAITGLA